MNTDRDYTVRTIARLVFATSLVFAAFAADPITSAEEYDIREAVFRYQFGQNGSKTNAWARVYFLCGPERSDPPIELIRRFAMHEPPVHACSVSKLVRGVVVDKDTGEKGVLFSIDSLKWISDAEGALDGGYYVATQRGRLHIHRKEA